MAVIEISVYLILAASQKKIKTSRMIKRYGNARLKKPRNQKVFGFSQGWRQVAKKASVTSTLIPIKIRLLSFLMLKVMQQLARIVKINTLGHMKLG